MMSAGSDAPLDMATRSADRSRPAMSCWARACSMVGTPPITVHRSRSSTSSTSAGWNRGAAAVPQAHVDHRRQPEHVEERQDGQGDVIVAGPEQLARDGAVHVQLEVGELRAL